MNEKRKICLVTNWYPTKENPYAGSFFKEQAFALSEHFDFVVVHYTENYKSIDPIHWIRRLLKKTYSVQQINREGNTVEYAVTGYLPTSAKIIDKFYGVLKRSSTPGIGRLEAPSYCKKRKAMLNKIFTTAFPEDFDVLYCVSSQTESSTVQWIAEATHKPFVVAEHAPFPWPGFTIKDTEKAAIEKADTFLAISYDKIRQVMLQNIRPKKFSYVGNLVNEEQFPLGCSSGGEKTFIMVAAHTFYKNYPMFIEIFDRLKQITTVPFRVMVVGYNANKGYSENAEALEKNLAASSFADSVELIPAISRDQIHTVYGRADAFVMTSVQEGMPVSALEAGCCGLPIFSTMCGGVEDYVDDTTGRIFKIADSETFAQTLKDYLEGRIQFDPAHVRQQIVNRYGKAAFTANMAAIFNDVIDQHKK